MAATERLLRLYPRAWRDRYGQEFLATIGNEPLGPQAAIDIVSGAIDAWLSADVRRTTMAQRVARTGGGSTMLKSIICEPKQGGVTIRDGLIGAVVMMGITLLFRALITAATNNDMASTASYLKGFVFPVAFTLSMPFWLMKGQPWKAQLVIVGGTLVLLVAVRYL